MALTKLVLKPGVNKEGTNYANENGFYNSDKIRFRSGYAEKIGGWQPLNLSYTYVGVARSMWAWTSLSGQSLMSVGTTQKFYIEYGTKYYDITPLRTSTPIVPTASPYITTSGTPTTYPRRATITINSHGLTAGTFFTLTKAYGYLSSDISAFVSSIVLTNVSGTFPAASILNPGTIKIDNELITYTNLTGTGSGPITLSGLTRGASLTTPSSHLSGAMAVSLEAITVGGVNLVGEQQVAAVVDTNNFYIGLTSNATYATYSGATVYGIIELPAGGGNTLATSGWGSMVWGGAPSYGWGSGVEVSTAIPYRFWSESNFGENLVFAPRYGSIYWWEANINSFPRAVTLSAKANTVEKTTAIANWYSAVFLAGASASTTLNVTSITSGTIAVGQVLSGTGISGTVMIVAQLTGTTGGTGTYQMSTTQTITAGTTITAFSSYITVDFTDGINSGAYVTGTGIPSGAYVSPDWNYSVVIPLLTAPNTPAVTTTGGVNTTVSFSYAGQHIPAETLLVATSSQNAFTIAFGANPYDPTNFVPTFDPLLVRWSDQNNPYEWVPEVTNQSGEQRLSNGSTIVTAVNTRQEILVWTDTALYSMQYLGPPYVWGINLLMDNISIASQNAAVTVNNVTYWMGVDKFYTYSGRVDTLPCALRQYVFARINKSQLDQVVCGTNEAFNEIWWFYPGRNEETGVYSNYNDNYVVYNHLEQTWYYGFINRTAWLDTQLQQYPLGAFSVETSYLVTAVDSTTTAITVFSSASYPATGVIKIENEEMLIVNKDDSTNSFTVTRGYNGTTAVAHAAFNQVTYKTINQIMFHEKGYDDYSSGSALPIAAYVESSDFDIGDGMNFAYVWRIIPDLTFSGSTATNPQCQLTVKVRQNSGAAYTAHSTDSQSVVRTSSYPIEVYTGQVYTRVRGRQMAFRMESTDLGVFWQMGMMRIDIRPDGRR